LKGGVSMSLSEAKLEQEYIVTDIKTNDDEMEAFLFTLGCYSGEPITVISHLKGGCVVSIKDARYNFDRQLAEAIHIA
jgi:ferrous iron transport protein A